MKSHSILKQTVLLALIASIVLGAGMTGCSAAVPNEELYGRLSELRDCRWELTLYPYENRIADGKNVNWPAGDPKKTVASDAMKERILYYAEKAESFTAMTDSDRTGAPVFTVKIYDAGGTLAADVLCSDVLAVIYSPEYEAKGYKSIAAGVKWHNADPIGVVLLSMVE